MKSGDYVKATTASGHVVLGRLSHGHKPTNARVSIDEERSSGPGPVHSIPADAIEHLVPSTREDAIAYAYLTGAYNGTPAHLTRDITVTEWSER